MTIPYKWAEELPKDCPPQKADPSEGLFYRLGSNPPSEIDFLSHRKLFPLKVFNTNECKALSLSVMNDFEVIKSLSALPTMKNKHNCILAIHLYPENGVILQTGGNANHYSWWKSTVFDISKCLVIVL